jgi:hypothetical protein
VYDLAANRCSPLSSHLKFFLPTFERLGYKRFFNLVGSPLTFSGIDEARLVFSRPMCNDQSSVPGAQLHDWGIHVYSPR